MELKLLKQMSKDKVDSDWKGVISGDLDRFDLKTDSWIQQREELISKWNEDLFGGISSSLP